MAGLAKDNQHFLVWATHPDHPNYQPQARGRKLHLSTTAKRNAKTLCNMLVVSGVTRAEQKMMTSRETCASCIEAAKRIIKRRFEQTTYSFTINTDASFYPEHGGIAAWATWIKSTHYRIQQAGLFPDGLAANSSVAELLAVEQALLLLDHLISEEPFLQRQDILVYFNTDSLFTVQALNGNSRNKQYRDIIERVRALTARYQINPRWVKGHTDGGDARRWVNNWCDEKARSLALKRKKRLDRENRTTKAKV